MSALDPRGWAATLRRPEHRRLVQATLLCLGAATTLLLYTLATRPSARRVSLVIQQQPAATSATIVASIVPPRASPTAPPAASIVPAATAQAQATASADLPSNEALVPAGATVTTRVELTGQGGAPAAVALAGSSPPRDGCAPGLLVLATHGADGWATTFDASTMPADAPLLDSANGSCPPAPTLARLGDSDFVAAGVQKVDGSARLLVFDTAGAVRLDLQSAGTGSLAFGADGATAELDDAATADLAGSPLTFGVRARIVGVANGAPAILRAQIVPSCDRGRLQAGSAAAIGSAAGGVTGVVTIACSSGALMSASVDQNTLLDILAAPPSAVRDRDYVELGYDAASLSLNPAIGGDPSLPRLALLTDNTAALRAYDAPASSSTRAPVSSGSGGASSSGSRPAANPTAPRAAPTTRSATGSSRSNSSAPSSSRASNAPAQPAPTRPVATRPALQPPAAPGAGSGAPP